MEIFKLFGSILIKDEEALKKLDNIDKKGANTGKSFEKMTSQIGKGMQNVGKVMLGAGSAITASMVGLVKAGADWSAEVAGQQFLYNNLDKEVQNAIDSNAKYAESIGLTTQQYKNSATTMATFYNNMGFATDETSKLSGETMNLVADLAAVTDMPFDEAMQRFKSGLMGNYEALDAFGINVSAASLENSEYVKSLGKTWNQLSDNEKMMAVYNEVTRQGSSAQGLAAQEAESFSMKYKLLKQQLMETAGAIGEKLLPVLEPLIQKAVETVQNITSWVEKNPELTQTILILVGAFGIFTTVMGALLIPLGGLIIAVGSFNTAMLPTYGIIIGVIAAIGLLIAAGVLLWNNLDTLKAKVNEFKNNVVNSFNSIKTNAVKTFSNIKNTISEKINGAKDAVRRAIEKMKGFFNFKWSLPKIKLPHFSVSGSANPINWLSQGVPKIRVEWYKDGGIMTNPTMFGFNPISGKAMIGGEAGPEAILPLSKLPEILRESGIGGGINLNIENFNNTREQDIKELVEEIAFYLKRKNISIGGV